MALLTIAGMLFMVVGAALVELKHPIAVKVGDRAAGAYRRFFSAAPTPVSTAIETTLLQVHVDQTLKIPRPVRGHGGGLASFGSELILLTNDGTIYVVRDGVLIKTSVGAPENNFQHYAQAADSLAEQGYEFNKAFLRYNDITVIAGKGDRYLVVSYIEWVNDRNCYRNALARLTLPPGANSLVNVTLRVSDWKVIARTEPCLPIKKSFRALEGHMSGGRMVQLDESTIAVSSGDFHWDGVYAPDNPDPEAALPLAQDPEAEYGKVLAVDIESGHKRILSTGNRNIQGIATTSDGLLWTVEHGPRGGDELNLQRPGANFGWPFRTYGTLYSGLPWPGAVPYGRHDGYTLPAMAWVPSVGISGLTRISNFSPSWDGDLLAASLPGKALFRIHISGAKAIFSEQIPIGRRIRQVHQHSDGHLVLWTDTFELIFLSARTQSMTYKHALKVIETLPVDDKKRATIKDHFIICLECHSLQSDSSRKAPGLMGLWNRRIGSGAYSHYSDALRNHEGVWNETTLAAFLSDADKFAPGVVMPNPRINDPEIVNGLISVIRSINTTLEK